MFDDSSLVRHLAEHESGQDLVEYALIVVFIALAIAVALLSFQDTMSGVFEETAQTVQSPKS